MSTKDINQTKWYYPNRFSKAIASPIHDASLIRLANSWTSRMWRGSPLSINLIVRWAQKILIKRSDITRIVVCLVNLRRQSNNVIERWAQSINQTKVDVNPKFVLCVRPKFQTAKIGEITSYQIKRWYYLLILFKLDWKYLTYLTYLSTQWIGLVKVRGELWHFQGRGFTARKVVLLAHYADRHDLDWHSGKAPV
jgi:hypothetical protein